MHKTNIALQSFTADAIEEACLASFDDQKTVAKPNSMSANDSQFKPKLSGLRAVAEKLLGWLPSAGTHLKKGANCEARHSGVVTNAPAESAPKVVELSQGLRPETFSSDTDTLTSEQEPSSKFQHQELCGRRLTSETQLKLLSLMVSKTFVARDELDHALGVQNSPDIVMRMKNKYGWEIGTFDLWFRKKGETHKHRYFRYFLHNSDYIIAKLMLERAAPAHYLAIV